MAYTCCSVDTLYPVCMMNLKVVECGGYFKIECHDLYKTKKDAQEAVKKVTGIETNGFKYKYKFDVKCDNGCATRIYPSRQNLKYTLYELNGKKVCTKCAKEANIL